MTKILVRALALTFLLVACSDTLPGPRPWRTKAAPRPEGTTTPPSGEDALDKPAREVPTAPATTCDLQTCGEVPVCFEATCTDDGECELQPLAAGTPCENNDFCDVLTTCDGAGSCGGGTPAEMYVTFEDDLRLVEALPDGRAFLVGGTLKDGNSWRPVAVLVDADGSTIWSRRLPSSTSGALFHGAAVDDGWIVSGWEGSWASVARIDRDGEVLWKTELRAPAGSYVGAGQVVVDGDEVYLFGRAGDETRSHAWVRRLDARDGSHVWQHTFSSNASDHATHLLLVGDDELAVLGRTDDVEDDAFAPSTWLERLARSDGFQLDMEEVLPPGHHYVIWADVAGDAIDLVVTEQTAPGGHALTLRRFTSSDGLDTTAVLAEGRHFPEASVVSDRQGNLTVIREALSPSNMLLVQRWDRVGNQFEWGVMMSPTGDPVGRGSAQFVDEDTLVTSGGIWRAQSGYAWSREGSVLRRTRPFHPSFCAYVNRPGESCLLVDEPGSCNDDNPCTADLCDSETGCGHRPFYDGMPCEGTNVCRGGECVRPCAATCEPGTGWCIGDAATVCEADADGCTDYVTRRCDDGTSCERAGGDSPRCEPV